MTLRTVTYDTATHKIVPIIIAQLKTAIEEAVVKLGFTTNAELVAALSQIINEEKDE